MRVSMDSSHVGTQGYCCYGPELKTYRQTRSLEKAVVDKFKSDLRRLLEMEFEFMRLEAEKESKIVGGNGCQAWFIWKGSR